MNYMSFVIMLYFACTILTPLTCDINVIIMSERTNWWIVDYISNNELFGKCK